MKPDRLLRLLLRFLAVSEFFALGAVFMPVSWMAAAHGWLGLGEFPEAAIAAYLARHLSAFYLVHGGFLWIAGGDIRRYAPLIRYAAWSGIAFSVFITVIDVQAGFPWYWMGAEGPGFTVLSVTMLVLLNRSLKTDTWPDKEG